MVTEIRMPKLGLTMEEGTINEWQFKEGNAVKKGEVLATIETDKVAIDYESPISGTLLKILVHEGETAVISTLIAYIGETGEKIPEVVGKQLAVEQKKSAVQKGDREIKKTTQKNDRPVAISPIAKRLAREHNISFLNVAGSGPSGRIVEADIKNLIDEEQNGEEKEFAYHVEKPSKTKRLTAKRMSRSFQTAPHFYLQRDIEMTFAENKRESLNESNEIKITYTDLILDALGTALEKHPNMNASWSEEGVRIYKDINIGFAVATLMGLVVAVIHNCNKKSIGEIAQERNDLVIRANEKKLNTADISRGTFTLTNLGMYAINNFSPILNPPQAGILATGTITEKPVVKDGEIIPMLMMSVTLAADHRVVDGAQGAEFLKTFTELMANSGK